MSSFTVFTATTGDRTNQPSSTAASQSLALLCCWLFMLFSSQQTQAQQNDVLHQLIEQSHRHDPWLQQNDHLKAAQLSQAALATTWPNMRFSVGLNNVATDGFDFNQEPMSHLKVGLTQRFTRGASRALNQQQHQQLAAARPLLAEARKAGLAKQVISQLLLLKAAQHNITLNQQNQSLTEDLLRLSEAAYKSAFGSTQQQDLIEAQLALIDQQDQRVVFEQQLASHLSNLQVLLSPSSAEQEWLFTDHDAIPLPDIKSLVSQTETVEKHGQVWQLFTNHPSILATEQQVSAAATQVELAEEQQKPAFAVSTAYGYRADTVDHIHRADLFSVSLSFDLPNLNKNKTQQMVLHKARQLDALEAEKNQQLQQMQQSYQQLQVQHQSLLQRIELHQQQLIPQRQQLAETNLKAYTHEGGNFSTVMRSLLDATDAQITLKRLQTELALTTLELNYLLMHNSQQFIKAIRASGDSHD